MLLLIVMNVLLVSLPYHLQTVISPPGCNFLVCVLYATVMCFILNELQNDAAKSLFDHKAEIDSFLHCSEVF